MSRRRALALLVPLAAVGVVVGVVVTSETPSKPRNADTATPSGATIVKRRDLVETDTESGSLSYAAAHTVYDQLSGTITWLPAVGQLIKPGQALLDVVGRPVILMDGRTPAYRNLSASDSDGADIEQLNRNLVELGFDSDGIVVDDAWQPATAVGVELLQESLGETETGSLSLGQIVFLPGDQLISTVDATLGSTGGASPPTATATTAGAPMSSGAPELVRLVTSSTKPSAPTATSSTSTTPTTTTPTTTRPAGPVARHRPTSSTGSPTLAQLTALLRAEAAQLKAATAALKAAKTTTTSSPQAAAPKTSGPSASSPSASRPSESKSPSGSGSSSPVLQTTSTRLVVTVNLDASKQREATVGERVSVEMPAGARVSGKITAINPIAQTPTSGSSTTATIPVTITLTGHHQRAGLDQATVSVNFARAVAKHVLSVPVTALLATSGGAYAVQAAAAPQPLIPVTTGVFAAGDVQISGPGIHPGLQVTDSQG
jgi:hypothetical protein